MFILPFSIYHIHLHNVHIRILGLPRNFPREFWNQTLHASLMTSGNILMGLGFPEIVTSSSFVHDALLRDVCFGLSLQCLSHISVKQHRPRANGISTPLYKMLEISLWLTTKSSFYCIFLTFDVHDA